MTIFHRDYACAWRDLADQLTAQQVKRFERFEADARDTPDGPCASDVAETLLNEAREDARLNLEDEVNFGHVPIPPGAQVTFHWAADGTGQWYRQFTGTERTIRRYVAVDICGVQFADGSLVRTVNVDTDGELTSTDARALAAALLAAAEEIEATQ